MWRRWRCGEQQFTQFVVTKLNSQIKRECERETVKERGETEKLSYCRLNLSRIWRARSAGSVPVRVQNALQAKQSQRQNKMWTNKNTKQNEDRKPQTTENETGSTVVGTERCTVGCLSCAFTCTVGCPLRILLHFPNILGNSLTFSNSKHMSHIIILSHICIIY